MAACPALRQGTEFATMRIPNSWSHPASDRWALLPEVAQIRRSVVVLNCENAHSHEDEDGKNLYSAVGGERLAEHPAGAVYIVIASCIRSVENRSIPAPRGSRRIGLRSPSEH